MSEQAAVLEPSADPDPAQVPAHVPAELVWPHDLAAFAASRTRDPFIEVAEEFHSGPDIRWTANAHPGRPGWVLTRYKLMEEVMQRADLFSNAKTTNFSELLGVTWRQNPLEIDPPRHMGFRQVLQPWFQPSAVAKLEAMVAADCAALVDGLIDRGSCDFMSEFALLFPSTVFLRLMGLPLELRDQFLAWEHQIMRGTPPEKIATLRTVVDYLMELMREKRRRPTQGDLASHIATARIDGELMEEGDMFGMALVLYVGGLDTVASSLGWYFRALIAEPDLQQRLRADPARIPDAVDEFLRAFGITSQLREVTRDIEFHGVSLRKGDLVSVPTFLASRDERVYADPHRIDIDRKARHLTLATGVHNCLGIHLAKRELRLVLEQWLSRTRTIRMQPGASATWHTQGVWGVASLPIAWD